MKKIITTLLIAALVLSFAACGSKKEEPATDTNNTPAVEDTAEIPADKETEEAPDATADATVAATLKAEFEALAADTSLNAQAIADALVATDVLANANMMAMPIEESFLSGFDNYEVKGFTECVMFAPMIGTIPFVGYVFTVGDGVDAAAFASDLEANANLRWNICVSADEVATSIVGDKVMFVMAPLSFEQSNPEDMIQEDQGVGDMDMSEEIPAFDGEMAE